ncbi:MAG: dTDP-4-dehydrorhamnose reductase [Tannerellaceae bacterium]|jgi:dTDP-4-dehydrorhamnose reductase|nr:dTDP-4-dehydrorhamnose reductase [Tannerellaceae bacterium]
MKTILVTGANGQLGRSLESSISTPEKNNFLFSDVDTLDICNKASVEAFVRTNNVGYIVNCAAYTAVDEAESNEMLCLRINTEAVRNLGEIASALGLKIIHISTDYVFDGTNSIPYTETDYTCPLSVYGRSKERGEIVLRSVCPDALIIRTSWLYSEYGNNFALTMLSLGKSCRELRVVSDQVGSPTYAADLACAILAILDSARSGVFLPGIYHYSGEGVCSRYDFARKIFRLAHLPTPVIPIETKDYPTRAVRPPYSVLNKKKIKQAYGLTIPHWEESLKEMIHKLNV